MEQNIDLSKYFLKSEIKVVRRSEIHPASYNPRIIDDEGYKALKRSIKKYGVVGGIIVNKQTGNTIVGGHQKVYILDEINKYDDETKENDYKLRVEVVDVDYDAEVILNVLLNNPNVGGRYDYDKLRELVPQMADYKDAGLNEADLSMIGVDFMFDTEEQNSMADEISEIMGFNEEKPKRKKETVPEDLMEEEPPKREMTDEEKKQHMKDVKAEVKQRAQENASNMDSFFMLSFDNWQNKVAFCEKFGIDPNQKFIKGEFFEARCEPILDE